MSARFGTLLFLLAIFGPVALATLLMICSWHSPRRKDKAMRL